MRSRSIPKPGDIYLLCSDGLSDMVAGEAIEEVLLANRGDLDDAAKALVRAANRGGGDDNITAVLFEIVADDAPAPPEPDEETREYATVAPTRRTRSTRRTASRDHRGAVGGRHDGRLGGRVRRGARGAGT